MTTSELESLHTELLDLLKGYSFVTFEQVVDLGIFGTSQGVRRAVRDGHLTCIKISARRRVIPRQSLVDYLLKSISDGN